MTAEHRGADALLPRLREDLALALRAAAHHGLSEGVCNHFSVALPDDTQRFLINPRGLHRSEIAAADIVLVNADGQVLQGRHRVEPTAMFIHGAVHRVCDRAVVLHTHMPYATALTLDHRRARSTRRRARARCASWAASPSTPTTTAWRWTGPKANASRAPCVARTSASWATTASSSPAVQWPMPTTICTTWSAPACTRCWRMGTGRPLAPVNARLSAHVAAADPGRARAVRSVLRGVAADVAGARLTRGPSSRLRWLPAQRPG